MSIADTQKQAGGENRPIIGITLGDAAGVGPEIIVKALERADIYARCIPVVIGDSAPLQEALNFCGSPLSLREIAAPIDAAGRHGTIEVIPLGMLAPGGWEYKKAQAPCGEAAFHYILRAIEMARAGEIAAVATGPINKEALNMAGHPYSGHTEIFAEYTGTRDFAMLLASGPLRVVHVSTHCSLREACDRVKKDRVLKVIRLADEGARQLGVPAPRIAVAGLNPHASENGLFGSEEAREIIPAIEAAKAEGLDVQGPLPADTIFVKCAAGMYDIVVAMYHDQGHIPLKLGGFSLDGSAGGKDSDIRGINCTIGLPIVRASVDHGTAFGKAGEGRASEASLVDAIEAAVAMAKYREVAGNAQ